MNKKLRGIIDMNAHISRVMIVSIVLLLIGFVGFVGFSTPIAIFGDSINDFECDDGDEHVFKVEKPSSNGYKKVENYCENSGGNRAGATVI